jgi:hypothetical protein
MENSTAQEISELYPVRLTETLTYEDLKDVIDGKCAAIRIKEFCSKKICQMVTNRFLQHSNRGNFNKASDVGRIGIAHYEIDSPEKFDLYHQKAIEYTWQLRNVFDPYLSPVDKIRLLLEEVWPSGAQLEMLYGRKCFVGICRIMEPTIELLAHNDRLDRDSPDSLQARSLISQLSACVYIQVPDEGGGLRLWMKEPENEEEYIKLKSGNYGIEMGKLGPPVHVIEPENGDLLIFNIRKYHGVAPGKGKSRINVGAFIGYRSINQPLTYWS